MLLLCSYSVEGDIFLWCGTNQSLCNQHNRASQHLQNAKCGFHELQPTENKESTT